MRAHITPDGGAEPAGRRFAAVGLALLGVVVSVYLTAYQLGWIRHVWDPVFGAASSHAVLHSVVDRISPVPDALLGAAAYAGEIALGLAVVVVRRPVVRVLYGVLALGMGVVSVGLVALQAFVVHHACTLCLVSAIVSWVVAAIVVPDAFASPGHREAKFDGESSRSSSGRVASGPLISSQTTSRPSTRTPTSTGFAR